MIHRRRIAQLVEQGVDNAQVVGSSPTATTKKVCSVISTGRMLA